MHNSKLCISRVVCVFKRKTFFRLFPTRTNIPPISVMEKKYRRAANVLSAIAVKAVLYKIKEFPVFCRLFTFSSNMPYIQALSSILRFDKRIFIGMRLKRGGKMLSSWFVATVAFWMNA